MPYEENHRVNLDGQIEKRCNHHHIFFPEDNPWMLATDNNFYKNNQSPDGLFPYCKSCNKKKSKKFFKDNPEKRKAYLKKENSKPIRILEHKELERKRREEGKVLQWQQNNKDKIKGYQEERQHKNHKVSDIEWESCKLYFHYECAYCSLELKNHIIRYKGELILGDFHKEHLDDTGANDLSNCIPSCKSCNSQKWKFIFDEWYTESNPIYSQVRLNKIIQWITKDYKKYIIEDINKAQ